MVLLVFKTINKASRTNESGVVQREMLQERKRSAPLLRPKAYFIKGLNF
jgi:hypothetical protein